MTEVWSTLASSRRQRLACASAVSEIKQACDKVHRKKHVAGCPECLPRVIDRMKRRYTDSSDQEWFTGQAGLLQDLEVLFQDASQHPERLNAVAERINEEKAAWIRRTLGSSQTVRKLPKSFTNQTQLPQKLEDCNVDLNSVLTEIQVALGFRQGDQDLEAYLDHLGGAATAEASLQATREIFFSDHDGRHMTDERGLQSLQDGARLDSVMAGALERVSAGRILGGQKEKHRRRLDELRRARAAHLKTRRARNRQDPDEQDKPPPTPGAMCDLAACAKCFAVPDPKAFVSCALCQVLADLDDHAQHPIIYCSNECLLDEFETHLNDVHICSSGDDCISLGKDKSADMDDGQSVIVLCTECLSHGMGTPYCSSACASVDFQRHRDNVHLPHREREHVAGADEAEGLVYDGGDGTRYRARNIENHLTTLDHALMDFEQRNSVGAKPLPWRENMRETHRLQSVS